MDTQSAANPAEEAPVTLVDAVEQARNQASQTEAQAPAGESEDLDALTKEALGEADASPEEEIEVEYEGEKRKLPPKWRDAFLRDQDYRRKTMDLAEQRKAFEAEREETAKLATQDKAVFQANVRLAVLDRDIRNLETTDTTGWTQEQIARGSAALQAMRAEQAQISNTLQGHYANQQRASSETFAKLRSQAVAEAGARIPNFTEQRRAELESVAVAAGVDKSLFETSVVTAAEYEILHYADIGKKFIERQRKAATMKAAQAGKPASTLGGGAAGGKSPDDMSPAEMAKHLGYG